MPNKNKTKNYFIWYLLSIIAFIALAIIIVPPMINLNFLKPNIEQVILKETGIKANIHGNINFSLLGRATIIAHNIAIPNGVVSSCEFNIPVSDLFNLKHANISSNIVVRGASLLIHEVVPFKINNRIIVNDSKIKFLNKEYIIIRADLSKNTTLVSVRTDQHKYEIKSENNRFVIENKNNDLHMSGQLFDNGTAAGHIDITAQNVNRWFEFKSPRITGQFPISADFTWNGSYGVNFYNISADGVSGSIVLQENGDKKVTLKSKNADYDLSFFIKDAKILQNASFDLDFYGKNKFLDKTFNHVRIVTNGNDQEIHIDKIIADEFTISGGTIDKNGAHNLQLSMPSHSLNTTCLFNGTPTKWSCDRFSYGKYLTGTIFADNNTFNIKLHSSQKIADISVIINSAKRFGDNGLINFEFPDMGGIIKISKNKYDIKYNFIDDKTLSWLKLNLPFLPESMKNDEGNFVWNNNSMIFIPHSKKWQLSTNQDFFMIHGDNLKAWLANLDLDCMNNLPYVLSGNYRNNTISNLTLEIMEQKFYGSASKNNLTLKTDVLNIDSLANKDFIKNYEELSFFVSHPITIPFDTGMNIALSANTLIYNNQKYNNFVYSLKPNLQTFSITDSNRGNILAIIKKDNIKYSTNIQLNKFVWDEKLLPEQTPMNISDTSITGEIKLNTYGKIAHDITNNLNGTFDVSFDSGKLYGLGIDKFYASANDINLLSVEEYLSNALSSGITNIKKMHIVGTYDNGDIKTSAPFNLSIKHCDVSGMFEIKNNEMTANFDLLLRGTSVSPEPIELKIYPNKSREFSLSEIMMHFDAEYMREFIKSHNQF